MTAPSTRDLGGRLLYSACWEDLAVAREALQVPRGGLVVAVGAAGDNAIGLLLDDPARVIAVDLNPAQTTIVELKLAAVRSIPGSVAEFVGAGGADRGSTDSRRWRLDVLSRLRPSLSPTARGFWDARTDAIAAGVIHAGRFERYLSSFRRGLLPIVPGRAVVEAMLAARDVEEQRQVYRERWDSRAWRGAFRIFFSRRLLAALGRHPAFFDQAPDLDVGAAFLDRAIEGLTATPIGRNPYMTFALRGRYGPPDAMPAYLQPSNAGVLASRADRLEVRTCALLDLLRDLPDRSVDAFYLSDIFELETPSAYEATLREIVRVGREGARLCYWNNLVDRRRPDVLADHLSTEPELAARLHAADRAFLYARFVVETVGGGSRPAAQEASSAA